MTRVKVKFPGNAKAGVFLNLSQFMGDFLILACLISMENEK